MESKTHRSNIVWDLNVEVSFPNHFFFVSGVRVKFRFERLRNKLRSITFNNCEVWTYCLELWEQFAIFQWTTGKTSLRTSCLCIRNGKLDTKWRTRQTKSRKENSRTALEGKFDTYKFPTLVYCPFAVVDSENVFCQGMVVLLHPVCVFFNASRRSTCCRFRDVMTSNTLASIRRLEIVDNRRKL